MKHLIQVSFDLEVETEDLEESVMLLVKTLMPEEDGAKRAYVVDNLKFRDPSLGKDLGVDRRLSS